MSYFQITGGFPLEGVCPIHGAKNSVLPILAACLLTESEVILHHCPDLTDVSAALDILTHLGRSVWREGSTVTVSGGPLTGGCIPEPLMRAMRSSIIFLGPLLATVKEAHLTMPGGCEIGARPIDLHLAAMQTLGAEVTQDIHGLHCTASHLRGQNIFLSLPSVGATENAILCACGAEGETIIHNAAREPEIVALQTFLNSLGASIRGAGGSIISIVGDRKLTGGEFTIPGDRIVAATLLSAAACAGGDVTVSGVDYRQLSPITAVLAEAGCKVSSEPFSVRLRRDRSHPLSAVSAIRTAPYPGFPTDAQPPVMAALAAGDGTTIFVENLFENRYRHIPELCRMGASIEVEGRVAVIRGVPKLHGARLEAQDLRGGGALTAAALGAEGESTVHGLHHIVMGKKHIRLPPATESDPVHRVEDIFPLDTDGQSGFLLFLLQDLADLIKGLFGPAGIHQHDHGKIAVHNRLADIYNIDLHTGQQSADLADDADPVRAQHGDNRFHRNSSLCQIRFMINCLYAVVKFQKTETGAITQTAPVWI